MLNESLYTLLCRGAENFGISISREIGERFDLYRILLQEWNCKMNLTAITEDRDIVVKHFIDSLSIAPLIKKLGASTLADIGTGAGFPGIPITLCCPEIKLTLVDSLAKRLKFLECVCTETGLGGVELVHSRAEDLGRDPIYREKYDAVTARAVASMPVLLEYCMPFVRAGGYFIAMKGGNNEPDFTKALDLMNGSIEKKEEFALPESDELTVRNVFVIKKHRQISTIYPRKAGNITKKPLL